MSHINPDFSSVEGRQSNQRRVFYPSCGECVWGSCYHPVFCEPEAGKVVLKFDAGEGSWAIKA